MEVISDPSTKSSSDNKSVIKQKQGKMSKIIGRDWLTGSSFHRVSLWDRICSWPSIAFQNLHKFKRKISDDFLTALPAMKQIYGRILPGGWREKWDSSDGFVWKADVSRQGEITVGPHTRLSLLRLRRLLCSHAATSNTDDFFFSAHVCFSYYGDTWRKQCSELECCTAQYNPDTIWDQC